MKLFCRLRDRIPQLVVALFVLQPIMDVLSYWLQELGMSNTPTLLLRFGVLGLTILLGYMLSDRKWVYWLFAGVCAVIGVGHVLACLQVGYSNPVLDLSNYVRVLQMPATTICLITFLRQHEGGFEAMQRGLLGALALTLAVELISVLTGTDPHTYEDGTGVLGWFNNTNSQSSNLCVLVPIVLAWFINRRKGRWLTFLPCALGGFLALFFFSTRLAYLGIGAIGVGLAFTILLVQREDWKFAVVLAALTLVFAALLPVSPMMQHMCANNYIQDQRQGFLDRQLSYELEALEEDEGDKEDKADEADNHNDGLTVERHQRLIHKLTPIYRFYVKDFVEQFGPERTMEVYNYSTTVRDFASLRNKKLQFAALLMGESPVLSEFFGLDLNRFTLGDRIYDVENDFHGIFYLFGGVGLAVLLAFLLYFVWLVIWALWKDAKKYFTLEAASYGIALILCLLHAYCTAGVLRRPNASVYLAAILAGIYYVVRLRPYPETPKEQ